MLVALSLLIVYTSSLLKYVGCAGKHNTATKTRIGHKMLSLEIELVKDALVKYNSVQHFRDENYKSTPYQLGEVTCSVHQLYNKMLGIYNGINRGEFDKYAQMAKFLECHRIWFQIDHLIRMIELWEKKKTDKNSDHVHEMLNGDTELSRRYQYLAAGTELEVEQLTEPDTTTPSFTAQTKSKRKNKLWHAGNRRAFKPSLI